MFCVDAFGIPECYIRELKFEAYVLLNLLSYADLQEILCHLEIIELDFSDELTLLSQQLHSAFN